MSLVFYLLLVIIVLAGGMVTVLTLQNTHEIQLSLFGWQAPSLPIGVLLLAAFLLGALALYIVSIASAVQDRHELKRLRKRVEELEQFTPKGAVDPVQEVPPIVPMPGITAPLPQIHPPQQEM